MAREHFSLRITSQTKRELERQAAEKRASKTQLAEQYLEEAVRMTAHPGILFRDGPAGRRAGVAGGPDVWEIVEVFLDEKRSERATAATLRLPAGLVQAAIGYYADHQVEIDAWIETNRRLADEAEAAWRRRQAVGSS